MNYTVEGVTVFYYPVEDLFDSVKQKSSFLAYGIYKNPEEVDRKRITGDERGLFDGHISRVVSDVFMPLSVLTRDVDDAVKIGVIEEGVLEPPSPPPGLSPTEITSVIFKVGLPANWNNNLLTALNDALRDALTYNAIMKISRDRGDMDIFSVAREKFEGDQVMIKSLTNYRKTPAKKGYRQI